MKTIVIAGAHSGTGKTTLALKLQELIPDSAYVKIGHGRPHPGKPGLFYPFGTPFTVIQQDLAGTQTIIIESNSILNELRPECVIYLDGNDPKPSARYARAQAEIIRGEPIKEKRVMELARKLSLPRETLDAVIRAAGSTVLQEIPLSTRRETGI
ncbi:MAG: hypothetical protein GF350_07090 [Chitinivibrionales bacterium]|nr:hypothetical protein [Chitinivibrionales bacterium]